MNTESEKHCYSPSGSDFDYTFVALLQRRYRTTISRRRKHVCLQICKYN